MADDKVLKLILTDYGKTRIVEAMENPSLNLALTKIRVGSGNNNEYYEPSEYQTKLMGDLGYEFYIYNKQLLEDGLTVSFHTIIPEDVSGFDIREVGLYETVGSDEHLFAIATQQPIVKPDTKYNYFININYYIFLKAQYLADIYDRITLDVEHAQVSEADLESLLRSFLFAQENLMLQTGKNSEVIGYNRPSQLMEKVNENKQNYSYITLYKNFASTLDLVSSPSSVLSYWAFDYSRRETLGGSIVDLSNNREYLSTSVPLSALPHVYKGFQSMFTFAGSNNYYLSSDKPIVLYDTDKQQDKPFTMVFSVEPITNSYYKTRTLLAKSDRATGGVVFEVQELGTGALQIRLYSDKDNYVTFKTTDSVIPRTAHSIVLTYKPTSETYPEPSFIAYINSKEYLLAKDTANSKGSYTRMNSSPGGTLYQYYCHPIYTTLAGQDVVGTSGNPEDFELCYSDGTPNYNPNGWYAVGNNAETAVYYNQNLAVPSATSVNTVTLYAFEGIDDTDVVIYLKGHDTPESTQDPLYDDDFLVNTSGEFQIEQDGSSYKIVYDNDLEMQRNASKDIQRTIYEFTCDLGVQSIYTTSSTLQVPSEDTSNKPFPLYEVTDENYLIYTGDMWTFKKDEEASTEVTTQYKLIYNADYEGGLEGIQEGDVELNYPPLTSYITDIDGGVKDYVNSSVGLIAILTEELAPTEARTLALNLCATLGMNPFLTGE